ncbi:MAG: chromosomal replication initiator protein DnaA [Clostridia bacterium]|nr:chromosomal replication initiator protein DnaA [Clostridia bacterium]
MDIRELWEQACELIRQEMSEISYKTWIVNGLKPSSMEGNLVVLSTEAIYMKTMISGKYATLLEECLSSVAGQPMKVQILTEEEIKTKKEAAVEPKRDVNREMDGSSLNPEYTFDTFVVGNNNRFAHAACLSVAESPATAYNPLFIYGGVGLGKTHLMHAVGHYIKENTPSARVLCVTSEAFTNDLISAIQRGRNNEFRERFRNVDVLMVDDIQFIAGRDTTQEEFFNTFNALHTVGKQIILTSDRPPQEIAKLEERLQSRFGWGLVVDIQRPDLDTRIAILRKYAERQSVIIPDEVLEVIATHVDRNIRELESSLNKLRLYASLTGKPITPELCHEALKDVFAETSSHAVTIESVIKAVADYYSLAPEDLTGSSRRREVAVPRQIAMYLARDMVQPSLKQLGQAFGGRDHSTVVYSCGLIEKQLGTDNNMVNLVNDIRKMIREGK